MHSPEFLFLNKKNRVTIILLMYLVVIFKDTLLRKLFISNTRTTYMPRKNYTPPE